MDNELHLVAADHPSLAREIDAFLDRQHGEPRYFGPTARQNPKPTRSVVEALRERGGFRFAAFSGRELVGVARVDPYGDLQIVVDLDHRGSGVGTALGRAMAARARELGYGRLVLRTTRRSRAAHRVGEELGAIVVDRARGRVEVILDLGGTERSA